MVKELVFISGFVSLLANGAFAGEESVFARVTAYWPGEGEPHACSNGARLRAGHCAVDPKKIPYGSKVYFPDGPCVAVDTGPAVVNRKAARLAGRNAREKAALVIDRFFESKEQGLAWVRAHAHFMSVRVVAPRSAPRSRPQPAEERPPVTVDVAQASVPPPAPQTSASTPVVQTSASPPVVQNSVPILVMRREIDSAVAAVFSTPKRLLVSAPPSYHRRRFAAQASDESRITPPEPNVCKLKRARLA
jgi:hypothetical protein